ncbi:MAG TPA: DNA mismatch repair protein MutS [Firmicutes bacterium]|nr:DNA mismatch repair protein MutS [Bacillota bacterium]
MLRQYKAIKEQYSDAILFFRLGDFYEMFYEDAELASRELEITLTSREAGKGQRMPMCGVPYHAAEMYIGKLVKNGHKVAICEQVEDPRLAKGIVRREVIRVVTPGTVTDFSMLEEKVNNYIAAIALDRGKAGLAACDVLTGEFIVTEITGEDVERRLVNEIARIEPSECLVGPGVRENERLHEFLSGLRGLSCTYYGAEHFSPGTARRVLLEHFQVASLEAFGIHDPDSSRDSRDTSGLAVSVAGALMAYLRETQKSSLAHIVELKVYSTANYMTMNASTRRSLELTENARDGSRKGSLLSVLDLTVTPMGGRLLRRWIEQPSLDLDEINRRLSAVEEFVGNLMLRDDLRRLLKDIRDIERLIGRISCGLGSARDLVALSTSLGALPGIKMALQGCDSPALEGIASRFDDLKDIHDLLDKSLVSDPPATVREGGMIRDGYDAELDRLRRVKNEGKTWIADLEARERERTGIKSLKVGYNQVFGYYIEVTRPNLHLVPEDYIRKQTMANAERFITPELKEFESQVLGAEERIIEIEYNLFVDIRDKVSAQAERILKVATLIAELDVFASLAEVAERRGYVRPEVNAGDSIIIKDGRHPVVEAMLDGVFVPNDTVLIPQENQVMLITGPNMAGKSTYIRQVALIVIMAQMGSFVPAREARIGIVDQVLTRIGAGDDVSAGYSTFMMEMIEAREHLVAAARRRPRPGAGQHADRLPKHSLVLVDELGRGTSTYDGIAIAQAYVEAMARAGGCKVLFSTHFHELTRLEGEVEGVRNYHMETVVEEGKPVFLYKIAPGPVARSFGINVARMAGFDAAFCRRAEQILKDLERRNPERLQLSFFDMAAPFDMAVPAERVELAEQLKSAQQEGECDQRGIGGGDAAAAGEAGDGGIMGDCAGQEVLDCIRDLDLDNMTPIQALQRLHELRQKLLR